MEQHEKKAAFGIVDQQIMRREDLSAEAKAVYCYLTTFADMSGRAFPSIQLMAKELRMSEHRLFRHMKQLVSLGIISKDRQRNGNRLGRNLYVVNDSLHGDFEHEQFEHVQKLPEQITHEQNRGINTTTSSTTTSSTTTTDEQRHFSDFALTVKKKLHANSERDSHKGRVRDDGHPELKRMFAAGATEQDILSALDRRNFRGDGVHNWGQLKDEVETQLKAERRYIKPRG